MKKPRSAFDKVGGACYFARMVDKIRLNADGLLHADYHPNLGTGYDGRMCGYLRVAYADVVKQVAAGGTDEQVWAWCLKNGRGLNDGDVEVWNGFAMKRGWRDAATPRLEEFKEGSGLGKRPDLLTFFDYYEVDEGRRP